MRNTASVNLINILLKFVADAGKDSDAICEACGIAPDSLEDTEARVHVKKVFAVWSEAQRQMRDSDFGLHIGESMHGYAGGNLLFSVMMNSPTVGDAFEKFCRYHSLMNDAIQPKILIQDEYAFLSWDVDNPRLKPSEHISEALLSFFNTILNFLTENRCKPVEVHFKHGQPEKIDEYKRIFKAPVLFNQSHNQLVINRANLVRPIFMADPRLLKVLEQYTVEIMHKVYFSNSLSFRVIQLMGKKIQGEKPTIGYIARELAVSVRNLQNKLKEEGASYQQLLDYTRKEMALKYFENPEITLCDIAFLLGFSEQSAFNHAFKRWTGSTPKQYRKKFN